MRKINWKCHYVSTANGFNGFVEHRMGFPSFRLLNQHNQNLQLSNFFSGILVSTWKCLQFRKNWKVNVFFEQVL